MMGDLAGRLALFSWRPGNRQDRCRSLAHVRLFVVRLFVMVPNIDELFSLLLRQIYFQGLSHRRESVLLNGHA
ncbi:MAG: hypothetical protein BRD55_02560 [Bacteroidetes bacterium SW_9_63_38]|nr:MAG: hypothetical protein BRD55_02560 [Bacteroidetes bacterium SW_9_63_38]